MVILQRNFKVVVRFDIRILFFLTLASLPACGCADPSFTAFFDPLFTGASAAFPLAMTCLTLPMIPPLPALELLSDPETFGTASFLPSDPLRRKTSKSVGRLFGDAMPEMVGKLAENQMDFFFKRTYREL